MRAKLILENQICRSAITWERSHAEFIKPGDLPDDIKAADDGLAAVVREYREFLTTEALPIETDEDSE